MSNSHDYEPDPIDKAYEQAESMLADGHARAARRARLLAAVANEPAMPAAPSSARPVRRPGGWGRGGWLAAAGVAGLSVFVASQVYRPVSRPAPAAAAPSSIPSPSPHAAAPAVSASAPTMTTEVHRTTPRGAERAVAPPRDEVSPAPPPPLSIAPEPQTVFVRPAEVPRPPPPPAPVIAAPAPMEKVQGYSAGGVAADAQTLAAPNAKAVGRAFAARSAALQPDLGARLRDAAASGRSAEVESLLNRGTPVDAPAADGDTALMQSVRSDHPAIAAILRRRGASLDRRNHAGESARDMATASGDAALSRALGVEPQ